MMILSNIKKMMAMAAGCAAALCACDNGESIINTENPISFSTPDNWGRSRTDKTSFNKTDKIGVFSYYLPNGNVQTDLPDLMYNVETTLTDEGWTYKPTKYWSTNPADKWIFMAYYPYGTNEITVTKNTESVSLNITPTYNTDLLIAMPEEYAKPDNNTVGLKFNHLLAKVQITAKHLSNNFPITSGTNELRIKSIKFNSYPIEKTLKLKRGSLTSSEVLNDYTITSTDFSSVEITATEQSILTRYVLPGALNNISITLASGAISEPEITIPLNGASGINIDAGKTTKIDLNITVTGMNISVNTDWTTVIESTLTI